MCNYVLEHIDEADFDLDEQEYVIEEFEDFIEELEYVDFEDEDEANYYLNDLYDLLDNTDIFLGLRESLNEDKSELTKADILNWLAEHDQAYDDAEKFFNGNLTGTSVEDLKAWISDHNQLASDFEGHFNCSLDESLKEALNDTYNVGDIVQIEDDYKPNTYFGKFEVIREVPKEELINTHWYDIPDRIYEVKNIDSKLFLDELSYINSSEMRPFNESLKEEKITGGNMEQEDINLIEPLINFLDELENNYKDVCTGITWNFGRRKSDNKMTAGVDVYLKGDFDNEDSEDYWLKKDEELLDRIRDYLPDYGFKLDDSLGYESDPWKEHAFGQGYHTQIIEDAEEVVEESFGYKPSFDEWYFQETGVNTSDLTDEQYDELWADEDLMNHYRKFCDGLDESLNEFLTPEEEKPPVYKIYYKPRTSSNITTKNFAVSAKSKEKALSAISDLKKMGCKINRGIRWQEGVGDTPIHNLETLDEDTVKQDGKWVNKGKEGTHGKFKTKKEADAQRKAMFANGYKG